MNRILSFSNPFIVFFLLVFLSGCYYDKFEASDPETQISYARDIQPIFDAHCTVCHPALVATPDLSPGVAYNNINNGTYIIANDLDRSILYQRLLGNPGIMPPGGSLSASEINSVKNWIEQGALDN